MFRFLKVLILILLGFAFANHHEVTVSFDPFASTDSAAFSIAAPLFAVVIVAAMLGVVAGALAAWVSQGRHRRSSRQRRGEGEKWGGQVHALKASIRLNPAAHKLTPTHDFRSLTALSRNFLTPNHHVLRSAKARLEGRYRT